MLDDKPTHSVCLHSPARLSIGSFKNQRISRACRFSKLPNPDPRILSRFVEVVFKADDICHCRLYPYDRS